MRSIDLLEIVDRHGLVTVDLATAVFGCTENAFIKQAGRLVKTGRLGCWPLFAGRKYWARKKLGPQALARTFAIAAYRLYRDNETAAARLSMDGEILVSVRLYMPVSGENQIISVDLGGTAGHMARKALQFLRLNEGRDLSGLCFVILTYSADKALAIEHSLNLHTWPFPFRIVVIPDLLPLVTHATHRP